MAEVARYSDESQNRVSTRLYINMAWTREEDALLKQWHPDFATLKRLLPSRSLAAIRTRSLVLRRLMRSPLQQWSQAEALRLKRACSEGLYFSAIKALFPERSKSSVLQKIKHERFDFARRRQSLTPTGNKVCDAIRERASELGYSMQELDEMAETGTYYHDAPLVKLGKRVHSLDKIVRGIEALGGVVSVHFPD